VTFADVGLLTMFGYANSIELYDPTTGTWAAPILLPSPPVFPAWITASTRGRI
jgi:hypothetical protein